MSDTLRALLGDKYDDVIQRALAAVDTPHHGYQVTRGYVNGRDVDAALSAVLPDLLAAAWGEGYAAAVGDHLIECDGSDGDDMSQDVLDFTEATA